MIETLRHALCNCHGEWFIFAGLFTFLPLVGWRIKAWTNRKKREHRHQPGRHAA